MELCSRLAEARLRLAFIEATLSGHGASTGVINVSDQRYQDAVDGMENGMEDLKMGDPTVQIRIVFSTIDIVNEQGKLAKQATPGAESSLSRSGRDQTSGERNTKS